MNGKNPARGALLLVLVFITIHQARYNIARPFVPLYIDAAGAGPLAVGLVAAAAALLPMVLAVPTGIFGDRHGVRGMLALGTATATAGLALMAVSTNLVVVIAAQMLTGLSHMLVILGLQPHVSRLATGRRRERHMAWYSVATSLGLIGGPLLAGLLLVPLSYPQMFLVAGIIGMLPLALIPLVREGRLDASPAEHGRTPRNALHNLRSPAVQTGIVISAATSIIDSLRVSFLPIYLDQAAMLSPSAIGVALAVFSIATLGARLLLPWILDLAGRWPVVALALASGGVAAAVMPWTAAILAPGLIALMGLSFGIGKPLSLVFVSEGSSESNRGLVMGMRVTANRIVDFGSPIMFGGLIGLFGLAASFTSAAGLVGAATVYVFALRTRSPSR